MQIEETNISGVLVIRPRIFRDDRGYFFEARNEQLRRELHGRTHRDITFAMGSVSRSRAHVLRGLHVQLPYFTQAKLIRVLEGVVRNVGVDLRKGSPTYGQHVAVTLSADDHCTLWLPWGIANGFVVLTDHALYSYDVTDPYCPRSERTILWNDCDLGIDWGINAPVVSEKDAQGMSFRAFDRINPFTGPPSPM